MRPFICGVQLYPLMVFVGALVFMMLAMARLKLDGNQRLKTGIDLVMLIWLSSIGGRILFHFHFLETQLSWWDYIYPYSRNGFAVYGGLISGTLVVLAYCQIKGKSFFRTMDKLMPGILLGIAIGRIGCFLGGCCYGKVWSGPWAVQFPYGSEPHKWQLSNKLVSVFSQPLFVHPTQIYELIGLILLTGMGLVIEKRYLNFDGGFFFLGMGGYSLLRLINLCFRANPNNDLPVLFYPFLYMTLIILAIAGFYKCRWKGSKET